MWHELMWYNLMWYNERERQWRNNEKRRDKEYREEENAGIRSENVSYDLLSNIRRDAKGNEKMGR